jgi:conjugative transfer pilus assembly protein TraH
MKKLYKSAVAAVVGATLSLATLNTAYSAGVGGVLDGMFSNVTAPDVVSNQFRGTISGGGAYIRMPTSGIQVLSIDPPRLTSGCGGVDLYLGSFSFITAEKLTQFLRNVAQNAAPLAFKLALDSMFPQLGGILDKFQHMAQMMNDSQRNSCQLAKGIFDGSLVKGDAKASFENATNNAIKSASGWATDFFDSAVKLATEPSGGKKEVTALVDANGNYKVSHEGNSTWNALRARRVSGYANLIADSEVSGNQLLLSMLGTEVSVPGATKHDNKKDESFGRAKLTYSQLVKPEQNSAGIIGVPIWSCGSDTDKCLTPVEGFFPTTGVTGAVRKMMFGNEKAVTLGDSNSTTDSIIYKIAHCSSGTCALTTQQMAFLNSVATVPAVGFLLKSQKDPGTVGAIATPLVDLMIDQVAVVYGRSVLDALISTFSKTDVPKPDGYEAAIQTTLSDIARYEERNAANMSKLNQIAQFIDSVKRANSKTFAYKN